MILFLVGCLLLLLSFVLVLISYRMYSYGGLLQDGLIFVRVLTSDKVYYGWVKKNSILGLDKISQDRYQWFIELMNKSIIVVKIEDIKEINRVNSFIKVILFSVSADKVKRF